MMMTEQRMLEYAQWAAKRGRTPEDKFLQYALQINEQACTWWLRTPGVLKYNRVIVYRDGSVSMDGRESFSSSYSASGVRPAMWVMLPETTEYIQPSTSVPIPSQTPNTDLPASDTLNFIIEDIFTIGSGTSATTVVTGTISEGSVSVAQKVTITKNDGRILNATVSGIRKNFADSTTMNTASSGDTVGLELQGVTAKEVERGDVISISH